MFALKSFIGTSFSPAQKIAGLKTALAIVVFLFLLMVFYRFMDLTIRDEKNKVTTATQQTAIEGHKENDKAAGKAAVAIAEVKAKAEVVEVKRKVAEAKVVAKHQQMVQTKATSEPLYSVPTSTENQLSQIRIDSLWAKYCEATKQKEAPCVQ